MISVSVMGFVMIQVPTCFGPDIERAADWKEANSRPELTTQSKTLYLSTIALLVLVLRFDPLGGQSTTTKKKKKKKRESTSKRAATKRGDKLIQPVL